MSGPLSSNISDLKEAYGVVVVGSGYGGGITAARLAAAGHSVCVLERGKEWAVGDFPKDVIGLTEELRSRDNPTGLYDYQLGHDIDVFSGSGLGGTSLINANVAIRPTPEVFQRARWPKAIRDLAANGGLDAYFARAEEGLGVEEVRPREGDGELPPKVRAHHKSAAETSGSHRTLRLAVNFAKDGFNMHKRSVKSCTFCGDCVTGCNVGAKNTVAMTYLPFAHNEGAEIFTCVEVRFVLRGEGGYFVFATYHDDVAGISEEKVVFARVVVLSAGALGSTGILLRSRERGLSTSARLGHHFGSNGDQLGFGFNTDVQVDSSGVGHDPDRSEKMHSVGPTIMSVIDYREGGGGFIIEEGAIPSALVPAVRGVAAKAALLTGRDTDGGFFDEAKELGRIVMDQLGGGRGGALNHSMLYLGMGDDDADGRIVLDHHGNPRVIWGAAGEKPIFETLSAKMLELVRPLGGTFVENPRFLRISGHNPITVHPLGGCPMGDTVHEGVVDAFGQAFQADGTLHDGLFVIDGSTIPVALMCNPFLTISALSELAAEKLAARLDGEKAAPSVVPARPHIASPPPGIEFTEKMRGHMTRAITNARTPDEYKQAEIRGVAEESPFDFRLTIIVDDVAAFVASKERVARVEGYVDSKLFGKRRLVERGHFNLFIEDPEKHTKRMIYHLEFTGDDGQPYALDGFKEIRDDPGFDLWGDNTTLFSTVSRDGVPVAQGIIHVRPGDFANQLTSFRVHRGGDGVTAKGRVLHRFGKFFFGELWGTYVAQDSP